METFVRHKNVMARVWTFKVIQSLRKKVRLLMLGWRRERCDNQNRQTYHNSQLHALKHLCNSPKKRREKRKKKSH